MERTNLDPTLDHEVVWNGATPDRFGGFTKGELLAPRDEITNPIFLNGEAAGGETTNRDVRLPVQTAGRRYAA